MLDNPLVFVGLFSLLTMIASIGAVIVLKDTTAKYFFWAGLIMFGVWLMMAFVIIIVDVVK